MRDDIRCEDHAALIGFLYDDCEPDERARIGAHIAICAACAEELEGLSMTRENLSAWTPPDVRLGFRVSQAPAENDRVVAWWSRPLPAWAQLAAAVVIFAGGAVVGMKVTGRAAVAGVDPLAAAAARTELVQLDQRLTRIERRPEAVPTVTKVQLDEATRAMLLTRVQGLVHTSENNTSTAFSEQLRYVQQDTNDLREQLGRVEKATELASYKLTSRGISD
jgi:hypothetical protein